MFSTTNHLTINFLELVNNWGCIGGIDYPLYLYGVTDVNIDINIRKLALIVMTPLMCTWVKHKDREKSVMVK